MSQPTIEISTALACLTLLSVSCNIEPEQKVSKKQLKQALEGFPAAKENHHHGHAASNTHIHQPHSHGSFFQQPKHQHQCQKNHHQHTAPGMK